MTLDSSMISYMTAKVQAKRGKIDKLNFIKIKSICVPEDTET